MFTNDPSKAPASADSPNSAAAPAPAGAPGSEATGLSRDPATPADANPTGAALGTALAADAPTAHAAFDNAPAPAYALPTTPAPVPVQALSPAPAVDPRDPAEALVPESARSLPPDDLFPSVADPRTPVPMAFGLPAANAAALTAAAAATSADLSHRASGSASRVHAPSSRPTAASLSTFAAATAGPVDPRGAIEFMPDPRNPIVAPRPAVAPAVVPAAQPAAAAPAAEPLPWWRRFIVGPPMPKPYSLREILQHFWANYVLSPQCWWNTLLFVGMSFVLWFLSMPHYIAVIDDSYITFRYSDHFIHGHSLGYNLGERVEGFTNFTWMVAIGVVIGLGGDPMFWAKLLGLVCCITAMAGVGTFGSWFSRKNDVWNWLGVVLLACNGHWAHWSMMGLETQLAVTLLVWTFARFYREMKDPRAWNISPWLASLAAMTRIEALYYMTPLAAYAVVQIVRGQLDIRRVFRWALWCASIFGAYFLWRYTYFGDLAPNTYYAKAVDDYHTRGVAHLRAWYLGHGLAFLNLCVIPLIICMLWARPVTILILGPIFLNAYYLWHVNGDWMPNFRFLQNVLPFLALSVTLAIRWMQEHFPTWGAWHGFVRRRGHDGWLWLVVELGIFGAWGYLVLWRAREIFTDKQDGSITPHLLIVAAATAGILLIRWADGLKIGAKWVPDDPGAGTPIAGAAPAGKGIAPAAGIEKVTFNFWHRLGVLGLEVLAFAGLAVYFAQQDEMLNKMLIGVIKDYRITMVDLNEAAAEVLKLPIDVNLSAAQFALIPLAILFGGWTVRAASGGRLARGLLRVPVYLLLLIGLLSYANVQMRIGSVYVFDKTPSWYPRGEDWGRLDNIRKNIHGGFSPPLQGVADWMLENMAANSTMYMSDIGHPMWMNPGMSLIDVDGLTNKELADAPSVRIGVKPKSEYIEEQVERRKLSLQIPVDADMKLRAEAKKRAERSANLPPREGAANQPEAATVAGEQATGVSGAQAIAARARRRPSGAAMASMGPGVAGPRVVQDPRTEQEWYDVLARDYRMEMELTPQQLREARNEAFRLYNVEKYARQARYVMSRRPEYCNIFIIHESTDPNSPAKWPYPDVSRAVFESKEFKDNYIEVGKLNKYYASYNHFFKRKDVPGKPSPAEIVDRWCVAIRRNPRMTYMYFKLAQAMVAARMTDDPEARELLLDGLKRFSRNTQFMTQMRQTLQSPGLRDLVEKSRGDKAKAIPETQIVDIEELTQLAQDHLLAGRFQQSLDAVMRGMKLRPNERSRWKELLNQIAESGRAGSAFPVAEKAALASLQMDQQQEWIVRGLADLYAQQQRFDDAIKLEEKYIPIIPGYGIHLHLAYIYERAGRWAEVESVLLEAGRISNDKDSRVYIDLGAAMSRGGFYQKAIDAYRRALAIEPTHPWAKDAIKGCQDKLKEMQRPFPTPVPGGPRTEKIQAEARKSGAAAGPGTAVAATPVAPSPAPTKAPATAPKPVGAAATTAPPAATAGGSSKPKASPRARVVPAATPIQHAEGVEFGPPAPPPASSRAAAPMKSDATTTSGAGTAGAKSDASIRGEALPAAKPMASPVADSPN